MLQFTKNIKQRGSITLLGALTIFTALSGVYTIMELGNKMIMDRNFDNYAEALAPVALRTELALTQAMIDAGEGDKVNTVMAGFLIQLGHTLGSDITVNITFGNMVALGMPLDYTNPKTGLTYVLNEEFVPLADVFNVSNPKLGLAADEDPPVFSAVAIELVESNPSGLLGFHPKGRAIYGIPPAEVASADMSACFCDSRYDSCLVADFSGVDTGAPPLGFQGNLGAVGSTERKNYCEYGYVSSQQAGVAKFPSVMLYSAWLGKEFADDGSLLIDMTNPDQLAAYETVVKQEPLYVVPGVNPFETNTGSSGCSCGFGGGGDYLASKWDGNTYTKWDVPDALRSTTPPDYSYTSNDVMVDDYFYVGRTGVCVAGTTPTDVPNVSGGLSDVSLTATNPADPEVQRCLSYFAPNLFSVTTTTPQEQCVTTTTDTCIATYSCCPKICKTYETITTCEDVPVSNTVDYDGYAQQSCRDFNTKSKARLSFFEWMISLFFGGLTDWNTTYQQLDCGIKKMQSYSSFSFFNWR